MITKRGGKYFLMSKDGSKKLGGPYKNRDQAVERERQVRYFKQADGTWKRGGGK